MSQKTTAVTIFAKESGASKDNFIEALIEQRKNGAYLYNPVSMEVTKDGIIDNSETIGKGIDLMEIRADEAIKNDLSVDNLLLLKKEYSEIYEWLKVSRISITKVLDEFKKRGTTNEKRIKDDLIKRIDVHIDTMKEKTFKIAEANIKKHLEELIEQNSDLGIGLNIFDSFIADKRKTAGMLPSEKTKKTGAGALRTINDEFEKIAKPIREAKELDSKKSLQSKQFEYYLDGISVDGDEVAINAAIASLLKLKESVESNYPDVVDACIRSIENKIEKAEANIRSKKLEQERDAAVARSNEAATHDEPYMQQVKEINQGVLLDDEKTLEDKLTKLRAIHPVLKDEENKMEVVKIAESLKELISTQQLSNIKEEVQTKELKTYAISNASIKRITFDLQMIGVKADDPADARAKIITEFAEQFKTDYIKEV